MSPIICNTCNTENHSNSAKCESCRTILLHEDEDYNIIVKKTKIKQEKNKESFRSQLGSQPSNIMVEVNSKMIKLENMEDMHDFNFQTGVGSNNNIVQVIKQEPELQIAPEAAVVDNDKIQVCAKKYPYQCTDCNKRRKILGGDQIGKVIDVWSDHFVDLRGNNKNKHIYKRMNAELADGGLLLSLTELRTRIHNLSKKYSFKRKASLVSHKTIIHCESSSDLESESESEYEYQSLPVVSFPKPVEIPVKTREDITESIAPITIIFKCSFCNESFADSNLLNVHQSQCKTETKFHCNICNVYVSSKPALNKHKNSRQHNYKLNNPQAEEISKFVCTYCGEKFPIQIALTKHKKVHTNDDCKSRNDLKFAGQRFNKHNMKLFKCELCGSEFTTRSSVNVHKKLHSGERPFACNLCEMTYRNKRNLRKHLFMHTGQRPFECQYCDKTFALKHTFNDHVRLLHTRETPYECEKCQQCFITSYLLNAHRRSVHNIDTNSKRRVEVLNHNVN